MDSSAAAGLGLIGVFLFFLALVVAVLWIFVPFAVFGIKGRLDQLIGLQRRNAELLEYIAKNRQQEG